MVLPVAGCARALDPTTPGRLDVDAAVRAAPDDAPPRSIPARGTAHSAGFRSAFEQLGPVSPVTEEPTARCACPGEASSLTHAPAVKRPDRPNDVAGNLHEILHTAQPGFFRPRTGRDHVRHGPAEACNPHRPPGSPDILDHREASRLELRNRDLTHAQIIPWSITMVKCEGVIDQTSSAQVYGKM